MPSTQILATLSALGVDIDNLTESDRGASRPFISVPIWGRDATSTWNTMRAIAKTSGYWPVFVTDEKALASLYQEMDEAVSAR